MPIRRSSEDKQWQEVKEAVRKRDGSCRLCKILTAKELLVLKKNAGAMINACDPAHYIAVSARPDLCYKTYNICLLNHYSHSMIDNFKNPVTGSPITKEQAAYWWKRILKGNSTQYEYLKSKGLIEENDLSDSET